ncbi:MAG: hypothetical protein WAV04_01055 [Candidatus Microsaccharimonas sp.]
MSAITLLVHVPVDEIEIVKGSLRYTEQLPKNAEVFFFLGLPPRGWMSIDMDVTLRTSASEQLFKRDLTLTHVSKITRGRRSNDIATFEGTFAGQQVVGTYNIKARKGSFRLAD